jgi:hypothetical protein
MNPPYSRGVPPKNTLLFFSNLLVPARNDASVSQGVGIRKKRRFSELKKAKPCL